MKLTEKKRIVVKVGTSTLTHDTGKTNIARMAKLVSVLADLKNAGHQVVLVSSGAVGIGAGKLGMHQRPDHFRVWRGGEPVAVYRLHLKSPGGKGTFGGHL